MKHPPSPGRFEKVLVLAYGLFFLFVAVAGSLWILTDLSAALLPLGATDTKI